MDATLLKSIDARLCEIQSALESRATMREVCDCVAVTHTFGPVNITVGGVTLAGAGTYMVGVDFPAGNDCVDSIVFLPGLIVDPLDPMAAIDIDYGDGTFETYSVVSSSHCYTCNSVFNGYYKIEFSHTIHDNGDGFAYGNAFSITVEDGEIVKVIIQAGLPTQSYEYCNQVGFARYESDGTFINVIDADGTDITALAVGSWGVECIAPSNLGNRPPSIKACEDACTIPAPQGVLTTWG